MPQNLKEREDRVTCRSCKTNSSHTRNLLNRRLKTVHGFFDDPKKRVRGFRTNNDGLSWTPLFLRRSDPDPPETGVVYDEVCQDGYLANDDAEGPSGQAEETRQDIDDSTAEVEPPETIYMEDDEICRDGNLANPVYGDTETEPATKASTELRNLRWVHT